MANSFLHEDVLILFHHENVCLFVHYAERLLYFTFYIERLKDQIHRYIQQCLHSSGHSSARRSIRRCPDPSGMSGSSHGGSHWAGPASSRTYPHPHSRLQCVKTTSTHHCSSDPSMSQVQLPQLCSLWEPCTVAPIHHCLSHLQGAVVMVTLYRMTTTTYCMPGLPGSLGT